METKKQYTAPLMEEVELNPLTLLAQSTLVGAEQTDMSLFPGLDLDASNALVNPHRGWGF